MGQVAVIIPAYNEADRVGATVAAAATLPDVDVVVVVDDGSRDGTARVASEAGASVLRHARNRGKAAAMETGSEAVRLLDQREKDQREKDQREPRDGPRHLLFLDADLGATAAAAGPLITPIAEGTADLAIAVFANLVKGGGRGFVTGLSAAGIRRATGWTPAQPLNGQRCLTRAALDAARPLAHGFGVETAMTIDLKRKGLRVTEVEVDLAHRVTGTDLQSQLHRARQFADVAWALAARR
jgi:glycosyltransferase involved in cell wall biosynthesis